MSIARTLAARISNQLKQRDDDVKHDYRSLVNLLADDKTLTPDQIDQLNAARQSMAIEPETVERDVAVLEQHRNFQETVKQSQAEAPQWQKKCLATKKTLDEIRAKIPALEQQLKQAGIFVQLAPSQAAELRRMEAQNPRLFPRPDASTVDVQPWISQTGSAVGRTVMCLAA